MSDSYDKERDEELVALAAEGGAGSLSDELVKKWDPDRLLKAVSRRAGKGQRLDEATRSRWERRLGADLSDVRIYTGEFAEEVARSHSAEAVTIGTTGMILMGGSPDRSMATRAGQALLAHELTHVAQSQRGVHRKASYGEATPLATEEHEAEAEAVEAEAQGEEPKQDPEAERREKEEQKRKVKQRVLDMFAEDARVDAMRNGPRVWRP